MSHEYHEWPALREGSHGADVLRLQQFLAGGSRHHVNFHPGPVDGVFGAQTGDAVQRAKWFLGFPVGRITREVGQQFRAYMADLKYPRAQRLSPVMYARHLQRSGKPYPGLEQGKPYPFPTHHTIIGTPYIGTHSHPSPGDDMHNWQSCNAVDIAVPYGTRTLALMDGVIGTRWGPLSSSNPVLAGSRMYVESASNAVYVAHLSKLIKRPGERVKRGDVIGLSGSANGVEHAHIALQHGDPGAFIGEPSPGYRDRSYPG